MLPAGREEDFSLSPERCEEEQRTRNCTLHQKTVVVGGHVGCGHIGKEGSDGRGEGGSFSARKQRGQGRNKPKLIIDNYLVDRRSQGQIKRRKTDKLQVPFWRNPSSQDEQSRRRDSERREGRANQS
jgi:hypothetical protein